jgi:hypothetical protein
MIPGRINGITDMECAGEKGKIVEGDFHEENHNSGPNGCICYSVK